jgi:cell division protein ZapE
LTVPPPNVDDDTDANDAATDQMPLQRLKSLIDSGELSLDPAQTMVAEKLDALARTLETAPAAAPPPRSGLLGRLVKGNAKPPPAGPKGLYIHGGVGRGKSMLMDLFFGAVDVPKKRRVHFHAFMLDVHQRLHQLRQSGGKGEPLETLARTLAEETRLLCFDEFHVVNIADAMILGRLFEGLFDAGVVVVATSNWPPDRLYEDGLNRQRFLPFIDLLKERMEVLELEGPTDYRLERLRELPVYHYPLGPVASRALDGIFKALADGAVAGPGELEVGSRKLRVPAAAGGVARFTFQDLCAQPLGAADYLALGRRFHSIVLDDVPLLTPDRRNEARRFMTLIDALYESRVMLFLAAAAPATELYPAGDGAFEFQRTVSRLMEMQSADWLEACRNRKTDGPAPTLDAFALTSDLI